MRTKSAFEAGRTRDSAGSPVVSAIASFRPRRRVTFYSVCPEIDWNAAEFRGGELRAPVTGDIDGDWCALFVQFAHADIAGLSSIMFAAISVIDGDMVATGVVGSPESFRLNLTKVAERATAARAQVEEQRALEERRRAREAEDRRRQDEDATRRIREAGNA